MTDYYTKEQEEFFDKEAMAVFDAYQEAVEKAVDRFNEKGVSEHDFQNFMLNIVARLGAAGVVNCCEDGNTDPYILFESFTDKLEMVFKDILKLTGKISPKSWDISVDKLN